MITPVLEGTTAGLCGALSAAAEVWQYLRACKELRAPLPWSSFRSPRLSRLGGGSRLALGFILAETLVFERHPRNDSQRLDLFLDWLSFTGCGFLGTLAAMISADFALKGNLRSRTCYLLMTGAAGLAGSLGGWLKGD